LCWLDEITFMITCRKMLKVFLFFINRKVLRCGEQFKVCNYHDLT
jgi:hypothetical protein